MSFDGVVLEINKRSDIPYGLMDWVSRSYERSLQFKPSCYK